MSAPINEETIIVEKIDQYLKCFQTLEKRFYCNVETCRASFSEKPSAIRHLKKSHPKIVAEIDALKHENQENRTINIKITTNPSTAWNAIIQMIIFGALPYAIVQSPGFRHLIQPFVMAFKQSGMNFSVNRSNIELKIDEKAAEIKDRIAKEVKGKMVCVLLDIASRFNR